MSSHIEACKKNLGSKFKKRIRSIFRIFIRIQNMQSDFFQLSCSSRKVYQKNVKNLPKNQFFSRKLPISQKLFKISSKTQRQSHFFFAILHIISKFHQNRSINEENFFLVKPPLKMACMLNF